MNTWTYKPKLGSATMWLKDLLPEKLPGSRVMTYEYDASFIASTSVAKVRDTARSLLEWLQDERQGPVRGDNLYFLAANAGKRPVLTSTRDTQASPLFLLGIA